MSGRQCFRLSALVDVVWSDDVGLWLVSVWLGLWLVLVGPMMSGYGEC